jgi:hypothetical protein
VVKALQRLAQVRVGDKLQFSQGHGMSYLGIDRKGLFQGVGRSAADSISNVANQKAIAEILMMGTEEFMAGRISRQELHQALAGVGNLTGSYKGSMFGKQRRHEAAGNLYQILRTMVDDAEQSGVPCLALIPGRMERKPGVRKRQEPPGAVRELVRAHAGVAESRRACRERRLEGVRL